MELFSRLSLLVLILVLVSGHGEAVCRQMRLNSNGFRYNRVTVSGAAVVNSMEVQRVYSNSACTRDVTYGFYGTDVWVNRGCRARFNVCYTNGNNRVVQCSSTNFEPASCNAASMIRSATIKQHLSNSPCVEGFSYRVVGSNIHVQNGCRARFNVGYTD